MENKRKIGDCDIHQTLGEMSRKGLKPSHANNNLIKILLGPKFQVLYL